MEDLFRVAFTNLMKDLKYQLERSYARKKDLRISSAIRPDLLTHRLLHALATGNWVGGRAGVSQLLDRTSNMSTLSHLRRITSSLTRSQPHFEARDLHPTQWGRLCPNETPEGQNCGLVKNAALIIDVSEGFREEDVAYMLKDQGVKEVKGPAESGTRVYVNGDLKGVCDKPHELVDEMRQRRRIGLLSHEINIRYDEEMDEVIINCDEGRLRRPAGRAEERQVRPHPQARGGHPGGQGAAGPTSSARASSNGSTPRRKRTPSSRSSPSRRQSVARTAARPCPRSMSTG